MLMIMVRFKLGLSKENLMLRGLLSELTLMWMSLWLIIWDIRDVDFEDVFVGYGKCFEKQWNCQFVGNDMV